jgi:hypothetical protein
MMNTQLQPMNAGKFGTTKAVDRRHIMRWHKRHARGWAWKSD